MSIINNKSELEEAIRVALGQAAIDDPSLVREVRLLCRGLILDTRNACRTALTQAANQASTDMSEAIEEVK